MNIDKEQLQDLLIALLMSVVTIFLNRITRYDKQQRDNDWKEYESAPIEARLDIERLLEISRMQSKLIEQLINNNDVENKKKTGTHEKITNNEVK